MSGLLPGGQLRRTGRRRPVVAMAVCAAAAGAIAGQRASELLAQMTLAQKLQMMDGTGYPIGSDYAGHIQGIAALGIPDLYLSDGAVGVGNGSTGVTRFPDGTNDA